jgi:hypothetical protein
MTPVKRRRALDLVELGGVLPSGDVRRPEVFRSAPLDESVALERWRQSKSRWIRWAKLAVGTRARRCRPSCFLRAWSCQMRAADLSEDLGRARGTLARKCFRRLSKRTAPNSAQ